VSETYRNAGRLFNMNDDLPFKVVRTNSHDEVLARSINLLIGRAAYETAVRMYPDYLVEYRHGAQVLARSNENRTVADSKRRAHEASRYRRYKG